MQQTKLVSEQPPWSPHSTQQWSLSTRDVQLLRSLASSVTTGVWAEFHFHTLGSLLINQISSSVAEYKLRKSQEMCLGETIPKMLIQPMVSKSNSSRVTKAIPNQRRDTVLCGEAEAAISTCSSPWLSQSPSAAFPPLGCPLHSVLRRWPLPAPATLTPLLIYL